MELWGKEGVLMVCFACCFSYQLGFWPLQGGMLLNMATLRFSCKLKMATVTSVALSFHLFKTSRTSTIPISSRALQLPSLVEWVLLWWPLLHLRARTQICIRCVLRSARGRRGLLVAGRQKRFIGVGSLLRVSFIQNQILIHTDTPQAFSEAISAYLTSPRWWAASTLCGIRVSNKKKRFRTKLLWILPTWSKVAFWSCFS